MWLLRYARERSFSPALARFCLAPAKNKLYFFPLPPTIFMFCPAAACTIPQMEIYKDFLVQFQYDFFFRFFLFPHKNDASDLTIFLLPLSTHTSVSSLPPHTAIQNLSHALRGVSNCAFVTSEFAVFPLNFRLIRLFSHLK